MKHIKTAINLNRTLLDELVEAYGLRRETAVHSLLADHAHQMCHDLKYSA